MVWRSLQKRCVSAVDLSAAMVSLPILARTSLWHGPLVLVAVIAKHAVLHLLPYPVLQPAPGRRPLPFTQLTLDIVRRLLRTKG